MFQSADDPNPASDLFAAERPGQRGGGLDRRRTRLSGKLKSLRGDA